MHGKPSEPPVRAEIPDHRPQWSVLRRFLAFRDANFIYGERATVGVATVLRRCIGFAEHFDLALVASFAALLYVIRYLNFTSPQVPWVGWWDQGEYLKVAHDLAGFKIAYSNYPLGYPLLGALFFRLLPGHPFFLPNLFCTVGIATLFYCSARRVVTKFEAAGLTVLGVATSKYFWIWTLTVPWNVIPVAFVAFLLVYLIVFRQPTVRKMQICGIAIAGAFFCRPWDAFFLAILYSGGLYVLDTWRERFRAAAVLVSSITLVALLIIADYMVVFGAPYNPYMRGLATQGMSFAHYPFKIYQIFLDSNVISTSSPSALLDRMPWLVLIVPGALLLIRRYGVPAIAWITAATTMTGFYLSANGMIPSQFWDYWGYRYLACWAPYTVLLSYLSITRAWRTLGWKTVTGGFAAGFLLLGIVGWQPVVVAQWPSTSGFKTDVLAIKKQMIDKTLLVSVRFPKPTTMDGLRLRFERGLMVPMETAGSTRASVKADGRPLITPWTEVVVHQEKDSGTLTIFFVNSRVSQEPTSQLDLKFEGIDNDTLTTVTAIRARFHPFGYVSYKYDRVARRVLAAEVTAYLVPTPWDLTGSAAGIPDGQIDFAVDCKLPSSVRHRLADMEILLHSGNLGGKWATHSRGMNWDKLVFMPGYVEENLRNHPQITNLADTLRRTDKFTILFKLPEPDRGLPLTLIGLDRDGQEVFEKKMAGLK